METGESAWGDTELRDSPWEDEAREFTHRKTQAKGGWHLIFTSRMDVWTEKRHVATLDASGVLVGAAQSLWPVYKRRPSRMIDELPQCFNEGSPDPEQPVRFLA